MTRSLDHRGPDDNGFFVHANVGLCQTRLSIIDLSPAGHQPMHSQCGRYTLVYNGELYNANDIKDKLGARQFRGHSDTEILLEALIKIGPDIISELNGMFAFAFFDTINKTLLLGRDRFGIKPLYISLEPGSLTFGSEIKSLFAGGLTNHHIRSAAVHEFLYYGVTLGGHTLFEAIERLLPGHATLINTDTLERRTWCFYSVPAEQSSVTFDVAREKICELLDASIRRHLISDVPVGVFLSGGIDSSAITALASRNSSTRLATYSVGFDVATGVNELPVARQIADRFDTEHNELHITIGKVENVLERLTDAHDLPFGDAANIPLYLLCQQLSGEIKVVLQGDGGDEFFGGYSRYNWLSFATVLRRLASASRLVPGELRNRLLGLPISRILDAFSQDDATMMALLLTEETVESAPTRVLSPEWKANVQQQDPFRRYKDVARTIEGDNFVQRMLKVDTQIILPDIFLEKVDRSTMAHGIEVRVPFLDTELTDYALRLPASVKMPFGKQKGLLKSALRGLVPDEILNRRKTGFSVPYKDWLRGSLGDWLLQLLDDRRVSQSGVLDKEHIRTLLDQHRKGQGRHGFLLYKTLVFALWVQRSKVTFG